jgi:hypothetical protein
MPNARSSPSGAFVEGPERAFTRRQAGVNPIALELDRLAEQRALQTLGRPRPVLAAEGESGADSRLSPADADPRTWNYAPSDDQIAAEAARTEALRQASPDAAQWAQLSPSAQQLANAWDLAPGEVDAARQRATQPFQYDPGDPYWGGLEEDEAYRLWANRMSDVAKGYPDMTPLEREAFNRAFAIPAPHARR